MNSFTNAAGLTLRKAEQNDYEDIGEIWLSASLRAHDFLPSKYWWERQDALQRLYQYKAEVWVAEVEGQVCGFLALVESKLIALFVAPCWQRRGIGSQLLELAKSLRSRLELHLFADNAEAFSFYLRHRFEVLWKRPERYTGYPLVHMGFNPQPMFVENTAPVA
ncbi:GNAT family N-acetyltransferase [Agarivorans sp. B2Z047]|uniref:GNAT family N-acetyltransferase n=1 Tax=Agarivorans sp. B2Z047 TaxID=2652721 RepID=UPI00128D6608|nr:GNAT family N-acetyltransferase [Agarivorans sp. B2Z047]MPW28849.1 GNAT family N-acetyltransferase [Agarivorans sp. B2Z047]UQN41408.1 GNAT family N-acetyltransferase [Agarivorans sp. B2Z047]